MVKKSLAHLFLLATVLYPRASPAAAPPSPLSPAQELATFVFADTNITAELVAAEPDIVAPVALAFDPEGRMFVAEMTDYPSGPVSGRIKLLEDRDRNGRYETARIFATNIAFPNGVLPWRDGILVTAAPDIIFLKDTDDDGKADERRVILTGFAEGNQQLRVNGLHWGLDNWIYGANGRSDGEVKWAGESPGAAVSIRRRDFRFRPETKQLEAIAGHSQFGTPRDDWGNRFPVFNNIPLRHVVMEDRYLDRAPNLPRIETVISIAPPEDKGRVYALCPPTLLIPQPTEFFTSACGSTIYRGDLMPEYAGDAFICEAAHNLITRRRLIPEGPTFVATRPDGEKEFLASTDPWFHGVFTTTGPDGALYVVDFYRLYVEHPQWVAPELREPTPWRTGENHGRIWRIRRQDQRVPAVAPDLAKADSQALLRALEHPNGWWRDTAQRLLFERRDKSIVPGLTALFHSATNPVAAVQALYTLEGLGGLNSELIIKALKSEHAPLREHGIRLAETRVSEPQIQKALLSLANDKSYRVRFQLALSLGQAARGEASAVLAKLAREQAGDRWMSQALLSAAAKHPLDLLVALQHEEPTWFAAPGQIQTEFLRNLGILLSGVPLNDLSQAVGEWSDNAALALLSGLLEKTSSSKLTLQRAQLMKRATRNLNFERAELHTRLTALRFMAHVDPALAQPALRNLLISGAPAELQSQAVKTLAKLDPEDLAQTSITNWSSLSKAARRELLAVASRSLPLSRKIIDAVEEQQIPVLEVDPSTRQAMTKLADAALKERLQKHFAIGSNRAHVMERYKPALKMTGNKARGAALFSKNCMLCHAIEGKGHRVGPDLSGIASHSKETLLTEILDPSRQVLPDYVSYTLSTKAGEIYSGIIASETAGNITLRNAGSIEQSIPREQIQGIRADGKSLMPDGLEQGMTVEDMADLIEFLRWPESKLLTSQ